MTLTQKQHPSLGWSYLLGTHRDVSDALPAPDVLKAASRGRLLEAPTAQRHGEEFDERFGVMIIAYNTWYALYGLIISLRLYILYVLYIFNITIAVDTDVRCSL